MSCNPYCVSVCVRVCVVAVPAANQRTVQDALSKFNQYRERGAHYQVDGDFYCKGFAP